LFYILFFIRRDHIFCTVYSMLDTGNGGRGVEIMMMMMMMCASSSIYYNRWAANAMQSMGNANNADK